MRGRKGRMSERVGWGRSELCQSRGLILTPMEQVLSFSSCTEEVPQMIEVVYWRGKAFENVPNSISNGCAS